MSKHLLISMKLLKDSPRDSIQGVQGKLHSWITWLEGRSTFQHLKWFIFPHGVDKRMSLDFEFSPRQANASMFRCILVPVLTMLMFGFQVLTWLNHKGENSLKRHAELACTLPALKEQEQDFEKFYFVSMVSNLFFGEGS